MGVMRKLRSESGQMTIEVAVAFPVLIAVAVIAANVMTFFSECAVFDRVAREAVRVYAAAPAAGQTVDQSVSLVQQSIRSQLDEPNLEVEVSHGMTGPDLDEYTASLEFYPTLFGMGLRSQVFGVQLPHLTHSVDYVIDSYKPGVII